MTTLPAVQPDGGDSAIRPVVAAAPVGRRRRPSGEPPPLPRHIDRSTVFFLALAAATLAGSAAMATRFVLSTVTSADLAVLQPIAGARTDAMTTVMRRIADVGSSWVVQTLAWSTVVALLVVRRFRHLVGYLATLLVVL